MDGQIEKRTMQPGLAFWGIYEAFLYSWKPSRQSVQAHSYSYCHYHLLKVYLTTMSVPQSIQRPTAAGIVGSKTGRGRHSPRETRKTMRTLWARRIASYKCFERTCCLNFQSKILLLSRHNFKFHTSHEASGFKELVR
jgi:hypothetical protein